MEISCEFYDTKYGCIDCAYGKNCETKKMMSLSKRKPVQSRRKTREVENGYNTIRATDSAEVIELIKKREALKVDGMRGENEEWKKLTREIRKLRHEKELREIALRYYYAHRDEINEKKRIRRIKAKEEKGVNK